MPELPKKLTPLVHAEPQLRYAILLQDAIQHLLGLLVQLGTHDSGGLRQNLAEWGFFISLLSIAVWVDTGLFTTRHKAPHK